MKATKTIINNLKHRAKQLKAGAKAYKEAAERLEDLEKIADFYRNKLEEKTQELEALKAEYRGRSGIVGAALIPEETEGAEE